jgi:hypothetical protein
VGDFNGDGSPDLVVANADSASLSILLGNGDGTFTLGSTLAVDPDPYSVAVGDFDRDGTQDLAVTSSNGTVSVLLGNGDGTFQSATRYRVGAVPVAVSAGDFNGDGVLDLVTANRSGNSVSVLLGNGDGTFGPARDFNAGPSPFALTVGSFRGDGRLDLAVVSDTTNSLRVLLGNGDGTFRAPTTYAVGTGPVSVAAGDLRGAGILDLVTANYGDGFGNTVSVLSGNSDGTFRPPRNDSVAPGVDSVAVGDFNGDGNLDLATGHCYFDETTDIKRVSVRLGNGDGTFGAPEDIELAAHPNYDIVAADFNGDGYLDLATPNLDHVAVLLNAADWSGGGFAPGSSGTDRLDRSALDSLAAGDLPRPLLGAEGRRIPPAQDQPFQKPVTTEQGVWIPGTTLVRRRWGLVQGEAFLFPEA